ncbi:nitroreductase family protein [Candidatus Magnetoovum chiemensis]|nr:nitroreductase family protein [Candidatus Magnetoovum chiemensis]
MLKDLIKLTRSTRRFYEDAPISKETLLDIIDIARLTPSAANLQPLRYIISNVKDKNDKIFDCLKWAGYLTNWTGPSQGERPAAYIVITGDKELSKTIDCDHGIAALAIVLAAKERGYGACILGAVNKVKLRDALSIPDRYEIKLVIALGKQREEIVIKEITPQDSIKYYRDEKQVHYVPKRKLEDIVLDL